MSILFSPFTLRSITLRNRIVVSPMCQYSAIDGFANDWHLVHLGSRAVGGAGMVIVESTAVLSEGRISPEDLGIWSDAHAEPLARIASFISSQGAVPAIQLGHAGRKASTWSPWKGSGAVPLEQGGWEVIGPSPLPFAPNYPAVTALDGAGISRVVEAFAAAARRAVDAGFQVIELHGAHGYLLHQFMSPFSNHRDDAYGGGFDGRVRLALEVSRSVRAAVPDQLPVIFRISATDWAPGGWDIEQSVELARRLKEAGVDLIDVSSGGNLPAADIPVGPGYQVPFAERVRREAGIATSAVGLITGAEQAEDIIAGEKADLVLLAREFLREPYWPLKAAAELGESVERPAQYRRAT